MRLPGIAIGIPFGTGGKGWTPKYYVSNTGNDANTGLSPADAWQTIAKVNATSFVPGDGIGFKKGDTWLEQLIIPSSGSAGNPITFGAYGSGNLPVVDARAILTTIVDAWTHVIGTTNLILQSEAFGDLSIWSPTRASVVSNSAVDPLGGSTADELIEDNTANSTHINYQLGITCDDNASYTFSVYAKQHTRSQIAIGFHKKNGTQGYRIYDLSNGTSDNDNSTVAMGYSITDVGNGWYRISATWADVLTGTADINPFIQIWSGGTSTYSGDGTSGLYIWGAQFEKAASPGTYLATTTSAASADYYYTALATEPIIVYVDNIALSKWTDYATLPEQCWYWEADILYLRLAAEADHAGSTVEWSALTTGNYRNASIVVPEKDFVTIDGIQAMILEYRGESMAWPKGIIVDGCVNVIVKNCTVLGSRNESGLKGIHFHNSPNALIKDNVISYSMYGIEIGAIANSPTMPVTIIDGNTISHLEYGLIDEWDGIKFSNSTVMDAAGSIIKNNDISLFNEDGIDIFFTQNLLIENNYIHDGVNIVGSSNNSGIKTTQSGNIIRYNKIEKINGTNASCGIVVFGADCQVYNNIIDDVDDYGIISGSNTTPNSGTKIWNNTVVNTNIGIVVQDGCATEVINNIVDGATSDILSDDVGTVITGSHNLLINDASVTTNGGTYSGGTGDLYESDPLFVSASDFHLQVGSPAINAGVNVGLMRDYEGNPIVGLPDIGAYEKQP